MVKLSIIIPLYNGERYIENLLRNIQQQEFEDYEVLFINDGSNDKTSQLLETYKLYKNFYVFNKENEGICKTRNFGINHAQGEYIIFLDQDDDFLPNMFLKTVEFMEREQLDLAVYGRECSTIRDDKVINISCMYPPNQIIDDKTSIVNCILNIDGSNRLLTIWNCIYKTSIIRENRIEFDSHFKMGYEDTMFNIEYILCCKRVGFSSDIYYKYKLRMGKSTISKYNANVIEDIQYFCEKLTQLINDYDSHFEDETKYYVFRFFSKGYFKMNPRKIAEKLIVIRELNHIEIFQNACTCNFLRIATKNKIYIRILSILAYFYRKNYYMFCLFILEIMKKVAKR